MSDRRVIVCNYVEGTSPVRSGARAYVSWVYLGGNLPERVTVLVRSRGGRWISKWENMRRLDNFRLATVPPGHPVYSRDWFACEPSPADEENVERLRRCKAQLEQRVGPVAEEPPMGADERPGKPAPDTSWIQMEEISDGPPMAALLGVAFACLALIVILLVVAWTGVRVSGDEPERYQVPSSPFDEPASTVLGNRLVALAEALDRGCRAVITYWRIGLDVPLDTVVVSPPYRIFWVWARARDVGATHITIEVSPQ